MTTLLLAPFVNFLLGLSWPLCFLLVAIISSTDSAAVFSLLRSKGLGLRERVKSTLEIESGTNDPMAIFLTFSFVFIIQQQLAQQTIHYGFLLPTLLEQAFVGGLVGILSAFLIRTLVNKTPLDTALYPIFVLGLTLLCFSITNTLNGSGFLAVYVAGLILGNTRIQAYAQISKFQQTMTWLCQIAMFTSLGLFVTTDNLGAVWDTGLLLNSHFVKNHCARSSNANLYFGRTIFTNTQALTINTSPYIIRAAISGTSSLIPFISPPPKNPQRTLK